MVRKKQMLVARRATDREERPRAGFAIFDLDVVAELEGLKFRMAPDLRGLQVEQHLAEYQFCDCVVGGLSAVVVNESGLSGQFQH